MTSNQHGSYILGDTRATMGGITGSQTARWSKSFKTSLSSDCSLQLDCMKLESLVNAHQPWRVEYVLGSCTHRPSRQESRGHPNPAPVFMNVRKIFMDSWKLVRGKVKPMIGTKS